MVDKKHSGINPLLEEFTIPASPVAESSEIQNQMEEICLQNLANLIHDFLVTEYGFKNHNVSTCCLAPNSRNLIKIDYDPDVEKYILATRRLMGALVKIRNKNQDVYFQEGGGVNTGEIYISGKTLDTLNIIEKIADPNNLKLKEEIYLLRLSYEKGQNSNAPQYRN